MSYQPTTDDLRVWYKDTYVLSKDGRVCFIEYPEDAYTFRVRYIKDGDWVGDLIEASNLVLQYPSVGAISMKSSVVFMSRRHTDGSARYRSTLTRESVKFFDPLIKEKMILQLPAINNLGNLHLLERVFNRQYFNVQDTLNSIYSLEKLGAAINKDWYIAYQYAANAPVLFKGHYAIARHNKERGRWEMKSDLPFLNEEMSEMGVVF